MAIAQRHFRCIALRPHGQERVNPAWLSRIEELIAGGQTEEAAEAQATTEGIEKTIKPTQQEAVFTSTTPDERLELVVEEGSVELGHVYTLTFA